MSTQYRKVPYHVKRQITDSCRMHYIVFVDGRQPTIICREGKYFFVHGNFHRTLRDAIIYVVYGV